VSTRPLFCFRRENRKTEGLLRPLPIQSPDLTVISFNCFLSIRYFDSVGSGEESENEEMQLALQISRQSFATSSNLADYDQAVLASLGVGE